METEMTHEETPVMRKFREWQAASAAANNAPGAMPDEEHGALVSAQVAIENELIAMPATNEQDFIAKVFAYTAEGWNGLPSNAEMPDLWAEAKRFVGGAAA
jgi:hypothetical protein